ncbi:SIMPL domain-containing protein [Ruegeria arenilitoris]|uniref:SIMPL domain-containing protein n=1 Tax=Ruegeria arenilitoris TaxID=1173585 RepID=UPI00148026E0|nr:SIMPL domain-containing protein [Ruegeria arenilitoris]
MKTLAFLTALTAAVAAMPAYAEERRIIVNGTGTVLAAPDMATITLGVTNQDEQAANAMAATSAAVTQILNRLEEMGLEARDIQTRDLSLNPVWSGRNGQSGERPEITGFTASNRVVIRVRDLDGLGEIMDAVIKDGANDFGGLSFSIQEPKPMEADARAKAVSDATAKANQLAQAAGVTLGSVVSISDHAMGLRPVAQMREMSMMDAATVPVAGGEVSVSVNVTMEFEIAE